MMRSTRMLSLLLASAASCLFGGAVTAASTDAENPATVNNSNLSAEVFYQLLISEISANNGDSTNAYALMLNAAISTNSAQLFERAIALALRGRSSDLALQAALAWAKLQPTSRDANRYLIQIYIGINRLADALEPIRRDLAAVAEADKVAAIGELPRYFSRASDKRLAASVVEQALASEVKHPATGSAAWSAIGSLRLLAGDGAGALEAARRAIAINPLAEDPLWLGLALMESQVPGAEALVQTRLRSEASPGLRMAYIRKLLDSSRSLEARTQVERLTAEHAGFARGWLVRGSLELQDRLLVQAEQSLQTYLLAATPESSAADGSEVSRGNAQAYLLLAQIAEQTDRLDEARAFLQRVDSPQDVLRVQIRQAGILAREGKMTEARTLLRNAPELQDEDARTKVSAEVQLLRDYKLYRDAYQLLKQFNAQPPQDVDFLYEQAMLAERLGQFADMERLLRAVIALKPDYHQAYNALGYALADRNIRLNEARELVQKALSYAPDDPYIIDSMAWVEFRSGNLEEALRLLQAAYRARPDAEIAAHLGEVLWSMQRTESARSVWKEGLALNPANETLLETMQRLGKSP